MTRGITDVQILHAAHAALRGREMITPRDVYYEMQYSRETGKAIPRRNISLRKISRTLIKNGFRVAVRKTRGYSKYCLAGEDIEYGNEA